MQTQYFLPEGLVTKRSDNPASSASSDRYGLFSLDKFVKRVLARLHVAFYDDCCTTTPDVDVTKLPVFFNKTLAHFYYYDPVTKLPVQITAF